METVFPILQQFGKPGSFAALFASTLGLFVFIEKMTSTQARADFARYLKSTDFAETVVHLPNDTRPLFERVFGARHFSWRCVRTSVLFSIAALAAVVGLDFLSNPEWWLLFVRGEDLPPPLSSLVLRLFAGWAIWSVVPDYFNLLKTRKVLGLITARQIHRPSVLMVMLFADLLIGYVIFSLTFVPMSLFVIHFVLFLQGGVDWHHLVSNFRLAPLSSIFSGLDGINGIFFWPGMVPSIWLWFYVAATLIARLTVRAGPVFRFSTYLFDFDQHPIRYVGIVAAVLVSSAYAVLLAISKFAEVLSEAT